MVGQRKERGDIPVIEDFTAPQSIHIIQDLFAEKYDKFGHSFDSEIQKPIVSMRGLVLNLNITVWIGDENK